MGTNSRDDWHDACRNHCSLPAPQQRPVFSSSNPLNRSGGKFSCKRYFLDSMAQLTPAFPPFSFPRNMQKVSRVPIYHTHNHTPTIFSPHHLPSNSSSINSLMTIRRTQRSLSSPIMTKSIPRTPKPPSPVNVSHFPTEGWLSHTRPTTCAVPG